MSDVNDGTEGETPPGTLAELESNVDPCIYLTDDIPPVGGRIKDRPEDFLVEELPAYEPCGQGEHLYLFVEKRNTSTMEMVRQIARHFGVPKGAVGYAGLKDKLAVSRQLVSVHLPGKTGADFGAFEHERIHVLWHEMHTNKLRQGHLAANRFMIRIRGVDASRALLAHRAVQRLAAVGVPNRAGQQRFGHMANNHVIGRALLMGDYQTVLDELLGPSPRLPGVQPEARALYAQGMYEDAFAAFGRSANTERNVLRAMIRQPDKLHRAVYAIEPMQQRYYITAFQSAVFNAVLNRRLREGGIQSLVEGDLAWKHDNGAVFAVDGPTLADPATAQRLAGLQISPSGPMWGVEMTRALGRTDEMEVQALAATGVTPEHLAAYRTRTRDAVPGKRRPLRVPLMYPDVDGGIDEHGHYIRCVFELPPGAFATVVLQEIMKPDRVQPSPAEPDGDPKPPTDRGLGTPARPTASPG